MRANIQNLPTFRAKNSVRSLYDSRTEPKV
jgi:hypothetical protein